MNIISKNLKNVIKYKIKIDKGFKMAVVEKFKLILLIQNYIKEMLKLTANFPRNGKIVREELIRDSFEILNKRMKLLVI